MDYVVRDIAERISALRQIMEIDIDEMSNVVGMDREEYIASERGERDFSFTFLYKCAKRFGVDITELITGDAPKLSHYEIVRAGEGLPIERRRGFKYQNLAYLFRGKIAEPFLVKAKYSEEEQTKPIALSTHKGQEMDFVLKGALKVRFEEKTEILREGDSVYYDSGRGHGMIAADGCDCEFLAIIMQ